LKDVITTVTAELWDLSRGLCILLKENVYGVLTKTKRLLMKNLMKNAKAKCRDMCVDAYCSTKNFINKHGNLCLFIMGTFLLVVGLTSLSMANLTGWDARINVAICKIFAFLEGGFGALVMIVAGLLAIVTAAMGAYKAAMACLIVAVGTFILRAAVTLFFSGTMAAQSQACVEEYDLG
jgi:hypothetical protein